MEECEHDVLLVFVCVEVFEVRMLLHLLFLFLEESVVVWHEVSSVAGQTAVQQTGEGIAFVVVSVGGLRHRRRRRHHHLLVVEVVGKTHLLPSLEDLTPLRCSVSVAPPAQADTIRVAIAECYSCLSQRVCVVVCLPAVTLPRGKFVVQVAED